MLYKSCIGPNLSEEELDCRNAYLLKVYPTPFFVGNIAETAQDIMKGKLVFRVEGLCGCEVAALRLSKALWVSCACGRVEAEQNPSQPRQCTVDGV